VPPYTLNTIPVPFCLSQRVKVLVLELLDEVPGVYWTWHVLSVPESQVPRLGTHLRGSWCLLDLARSVCPRKSSSSSWNSFTRYRILHILNTVPGTFCLSQRAKFLVLELLDEVSGGTYCTVPGTFCLSQRVKFLVLEFLDKVPGASIY
jgi:hypothetical protein